MDAEKIFRYAKPEAPTINVILSSKVDDYGAVDEEYMKQNNIRFDNPLIDGNRGDAEPAPYRVTFETFEQTIDIGRFGNSSNSGINLGLLDVIDLDTGRILNRNQSMIVLDYTLDGQIVTTAIPGRYGIRRLFYADNWEQNLIEVNSGNIQSISDGSLFNVGVPFWPQVMSWPEFGAARVSADGKNLVFISHKHQTGQTSFMYRLINAYGQSSEYACVNVTCV